MNSPIRLILIAAATSFCAVPAQATNLLVSQGVGTAVNDSHYYYGGSRWVGMTNLINSEFNTVTVVPNLNDLNQLLAHDRLWIDKRNVGTLSATELSNVRQFMGTGRRLVIMGEWGSFNPWNEQIVRLVGGLWDRSRSNDIAIPLGTHPELTAGVTSINFSQNAYGSTVGGEPIFDKNWAMLWGNEQTLTLFDINVFNQWSSPSHARFGQNVAAWLAVPEPASGTLLLFAVVPVWVRHRPAR